VVEVSGLLDDVLVGAPPESREMLSRNRNSLARRLNTLERKYPQFAGMCAVWRAQLRLPARLKRSLSPQQLEREKPDSRRILRPWPP
jgi:hypothetical protein